MGSFPSYFHVSVGTDVFLGITFQIPGPLNILESWMGLLPFRGMFNNSVLLF